MHAVVTMLLALSPFSFLFSVPLFAFCLWAGLADLRHKPGGEPYSAFLLALGALGLMTDIVILILWRLAPRPPFLGDTIDSGLFVSVPTLLLVCHPVYTASVLGLLIYWARVHQKAT